MPPPFLPFTPQFLRSRTNSSYYQRNLPDISSQTSLTMATKGADTNPAQNIPAPAIPDAAAASDAAPDEVPAPQGVAEKNDKKRQLELPDKIEVDEPSTMEDVSLNSPAPALAAAAEPTTTIPANATAADNQPVVASTPQVPETITTSQKSAAPVSSDTTHSPEISEKKEEPLEPLAAALESQMISEPKALPTGPGGVSAKTVLDELYVLLPTILMDTEHDEMWGVQLDASTTHVPTTIVLQKFLRANSHNLEKTKNQLTDALKWRKKMDPVALVDSGEYSKEKFGGLGYVTTYGKDILTWNIYGAVKDLKATFGDVQE